MAACFLLQACLLLFFLTGSANAQDEMRFPRPEFDTAYAAPEVPHPTAYTNTRAWVDVGLLFLALSVATFLAHKQRSRRGLFMLMVICLAYFGFVREGCVCAIGSIQNVVLALFDSSYAIPLTVIAFFILPLLFALFFGRVFCAAVCPLGAIQDVLLLKPVTLPRWLNQALSLIPYLYLGIAVLFAATSTGFMICRYDPFVGFFRLSGGAGMLIFGGVLLLIGTVIGRPYCRFLCPYGVLLNWMSRFSYKHVPITPDVCIQCKLCENACPFGCINTPTPEKSGESREMGVRRLALLLVLLPALVIGGGLLGARLDRAFMSVDNSGKLVDQILREDQGLTRDTTLASERFRAAGKSTAELIAETDRLRGTMRSGGGWLGAFMGLVLGGKVIGLSLRRKRKDYETDRATCFSCARCFRSCPREFVRLGLPPPEHLPIGDPLRLDVAR